MIDPSTDSQSESLEFADVAIIGGGPAGAVCALALKQQDPENRRRIVVIERDTFPRFKVCGCCFNGAGAAVLRSLGIDNLLQSLNAAPLDRWEASFRKQKVSAKLPTGWALSRTSLDGALLDRAMQAGVEVHQPCAAKLVDVAGDGMRIEWKAQGGSMRSLVAQVVVVASGLAGSSVEKWLPWKQAPSGPIGVGAVFQSCSTDYLPGTIYMACSNTGYAGIVRLEDGQVDVAAALYDPSGKQRMIPLGTRIADIIEASGMPALPELSKDSLSDSTSANAIQWKGTPALHRQREVGRGNLLAIGDAAGYVEPFTGEGMAWAMRTAKLAAEAIVASNWGCSLPGTDNRPSAGEEYSQRYGRVLAKRRLPCRMLTSTLRNRVGRMVLFSILGRFPGLAKPFIGLINSSD